MKLTISLNLWEGVCKSTIEIKSLANNTKKAKKLILIQSEKKIMVRLGGGK